jgi:hypothetical protein
MSNKNIESNVSNKNAGNEDDTTDMLTILAMQSNNRDIACTQHKIIMSIVLSDTLWAGGASHVHQEPHETFPHIIILIYLITVDLIKSPGFIPQPFCHAATVGTIDLSMCPAKVVKTKNKNNYRYWQLPPIAGIAPTDFQGIKR